MLGTGFLGLGVAVVSEANFFRLFPLRPRDTVNLGLVTLEPGSDPDSAAKALRAALPADTQVFTRPELVAHEDAYWTTRTGTGLIFGSGLVVSFVVGIMVLYQTLATQITRQLPQFATLKAIGYTNRFLDAIVLTESFLIMAVAFVPALAAAFVVYAQVRRQTLLPLTLTPAQLGTVFAITLVMAAVSAMLSLERPAAGRPRRSLLRSRSLTATEAFGRLAGGGRVPLALRNLLANKRRLIRSSAGIGFAVLLMLVQLGFERGFFESSLAMVRQIDGDLVITSASKYQFHSRDPFAAGDIARAEKIAGIAAVTPLYASWFDFAWQAPGSDQVYLVQAFAFDPDHPPFLSPEVKARKRKAETGGFGHRRPPRPPLPRHGECAAATPRSTATRCISSAASRSAPISRATAR